MPTTEAEAAEVLDSVPSREAAVHPEQITEVRCSIGGCAAIASEQSESYRSGTLLGVGSLDYAYGDARTTPTARLDTGS